MTEDFRDCFVGEKGIDALRKLMKNGNEFCTEIYYCLQDRIEAEKYYAKALRKNGDLIQKITAKIEGSLSDAFKMLAVQTNKESEAHSELANIISGDICIPLKELADTQNKERKLIEEDLNEKYKDWCTKRNNDNKCRSRQFEKSDEIEKLYLKLNEISKSGRKSARDTIKDGISPAMCILPQGRHANSSERTESAIHRASRELKEIEKRYHESTKDVELARQSCAAELCRSCDKFQEMELDRIMKTKEFLQIFSKSFELLTQKMQDVLYNLNSIHISPNDDIILEARSNSQPLEADILLYDIYAESQGGMDLERRKESLRQWIDLLNNDIDVQKRANITYGFLDNDGSMSSTKDSDGSMCRVKQKHRESRNAEDVGGVSNELRIDRPTTRLLQCLYEASLYKIQSVYRRSANLPLLPYEYANLYTTTYNEKGNPTTFIRIPIPSPRQHLPSAPSAAVTFAQMLPVFAPIPTQPEPMVLSLQRNTPPPPQLLGYVLQSAPMSHSSSMNNVMSAQQRLHSNRKSQSRLATASPVLYPDLKTQSADIAERNQSTFVKALYPFKARHKDEIDLKEGDIILLMERRRDQWCLGNLNGKIGLFPETLVTNMT